MNKEFDMFEFGTKFLAKVGIIIAIIWNFIFYLIFLLPFVWIWRRNKLITYYSFAIIIIGVILLFESINYKVEIEILEGLFNFSEWLGFNYRRQVKILEYLKNNFDHQFIYFPKVIIIAGLIGLIKVFFTSEKKLRVKDLMFWKRRDKCDVYIGKSITSKTKSYLTNAEINHHIHVVGTSGYGKSVFLRNIILSKIRNNEGLICIDLKGDNEDINYIFENAERRENIRFFSLSSDFFEHSCSYNILSRGNAIELKDKIIGAFVLDHYHYRKRVEAFLLSAFNALVYLRDNKKNQISLNDLRNILIKNKEGNKLIDEVDDEKLREELINNLEDKELIKDLAGLKSDLDSICKSDFGPLLIPDKNSVDLHQIIENGEAFYIHLDAQRYEESAKRLGRMILQDLKTVGSLMLSKNKSKRKNITIIIDEFTDLSTPQFIGFLNKARASNFGIIIAHQELSDLTEFGDKIRDQIIGNTSTKFCFLQQVPSSAEIISSIIGTETNLEETFKTERHGLIFKTKKRTGTSSERSSEKFIIHPNEIKSLRVGECIRISKFPENHVEKIKINYLPSKEVSVDEVKNVLEKRRNFEVQKEKNREITKITKEYFYKGI